jgi:hypothetical protein
MLVSAGVILAAFGGCRSGAQSDVVERELRHQEDEIYCLKDYLNNYQQLLCQYREENESLKEQLAGGQPVAAPPMPKSDRDKSRLTPSSQTPIPPPQKPNGPRLNEPPTPPGAPKMEMGEPEVPPLRDTSAEDRRGSGDVDRPSADVAKHLDTAVKAADYELPVQEPATALPENDSATAHPQHESPALSDEPQQVVLLGQVLVDDQNSSPHVLVDVKPELASGAPADFRGRLSLMVVDPSGDPRASNLARWDFGSEDLSQAVVKSSDVPQLEFPLQLPPSVPTNRPLELWVRLLPDSGGKILAHATVDLGRESEFSSAPQSELPTSERTAQIVDSNVAPASSSQSANCESGWQVARPDRPLDQPPRQSIASSGWRTATQSIPMAQSIPAPVDLSPQPLVASPPSEQSRQTLPTDRAANRKEPDWSPDRAADSKAADPAWAPTR